MKELAIGLAILFLIARFTRKKIEAEGWLSFIFLGLVAWGLGLLVMLGVGR